MNDTKFNATKEEYTLILKIIGRDEARKLFNQKGQLLTLSMDIEACHCCGNPLKLEELANADTENFLHDIIGIFNNINRTTGKLENCFVPRYSK